jgi:ABC-2 type transport system permease protein
MDLYLHVAQKSFRRHLVYRTANLAGIAVNFFFTCLRVFIFTSVLAYRTEVVGYNVQEIVTYMCLTEALMMAVGASGNQDLMDAVMTGQVAMDFVRPWDFLFYWLSRMIGRASYYVLFRGVPLFILSWVAFGIQLPMDVVGAVLSLISLCLAILVSSGVAFLISFTAMWTTDARGVQGIMMTFMWFFSGMLLPPEFLPPWLRMLVWCLPFQAQIYTPTTVYLNRAGPLGHGLLLALQVVWTLVLVGAGKAVLAAGQRKLTVQGG